MTERERRSRVVHYLREGKTEDAARELAASREPYPGDDILHHTIGMAFASRGTFKEARDELETATRLSPESAEIRADLAQVYLAQGDAEQAVKAAEEALAIEPGSALAHFTLGRACFVGECARQARRASHREPGCEFPVVDGRTAAYLRAQRELETALDAAPPFADAVRSSLSFAYLRAGHYHAAAQQLEAQLADSPPGEEADRTRARLLHVQHEVVREQYWDPARLDLAEMPQTGAAADRPAEASLQLAHACWTAGDREAADAALAASRADAYRPRPAALACDGTGPRVCRELSDIHALIAGGLECIVGDVLRFLPFGEIEAVSLGRPAPWREAEVRLRSGQELSAVVPSLYRFSLRSPNDLIQSGRFTDLKYDPGERRYAHAIGSRNLATEDGVVPFADVLSIVFQ